MDVIICKTAADAEKLTARMIADAINAKPEFKLGLATGATMENVYAELSRLNKAGEVDFSLVKSWNLDEYAGLAPEHDQSYRYYMNKHLFNNVNIDIRNTHLPDGLAADEEAEAARYDESIDEAGGIDLWLVGSAAPVTSVSTIPAPVLPAVPMSRILPTPLMSRTRFTSILRNPCPAAPSPPVSELFWMQRKFSS